MTQQTEQYFTYTTASSWEEGLKQGDKTVFFLLLQQLLKYYEHNNTYLKYESLTFRWKNQHGNIITAKHHDTVTNVNNISLLSDMIPKMMKIDCL